MGNTPSSRRRRGGNGASHTQQEESSVRTQGRRRGTMGIEDRRDQNAETNRAGGLRVRSSNSAVPSNGGDVSRSGSLHFQEARNGSHIEGETCASATFSDKGECVETPRLRRGGEEPLELNPYSSHGIHAVGGDLDRQPRQLEPSFVTPQAQLQREPRASLHAENRGSHHEEFAEFIPRISNRFEWMGRSAESLFLGHNLVAPVLSLPDDIAYKTRCPCYRCVHDMGSSHGNSSQDQRRSPRPQKPDTDIQRTESGGPNVVLSLLAREAMGWPTSKRLAHSVNRLKAIGGQSLFSALDKPAGGMLSETTLLKEAIENEDWVETQAVVSRLAPRLVGDPSAVMGGNHGQSIDDPSLPTSASPYRGGGGRLGYERESFVLSGGMELLVRVFREPSFVGNHLIYSNDARDLSKELVSTKMSGCWNEIMASLRELIYALPDVIEPSSILDGGNFLPFLFTLLSHDSCFDGAATLIEEILSYQSQIPSTPILDSRGAEDVLQDSADLRRRTGYGSATTFFLGNVPDLYSLWGGFSCRQLAHFCRILALLVFEPEDRQLLESPSVLKSTELLQLRRDRAARAGQDAAVDMNQSILLGDPELLEKLLQLMKVMNFAPELKRGTVYHVMAHFPWIADTLAMLGLTEFVDWSEVDVVQELARKKLDLRSKDLATHTSDEVETLALSDLGAVASMLEDLEELFAESSNEQATQLGHIIRVVNAAQSAGVVDGRQAPGRPENTRLDNVNQPVGGIRYTDTAVMETMGFGLAGGPSMHVFRRGRRRFRISTPQDAANAMQFNALLLAPYQVEVLFVLCTLLGGRRKIDTQRRLDHLGLVPILDDMFHRLSWGHTALEPRQAAPADGLGVDQEESPSGIHGPGCECNPETALRVQYLRLLHNFCDQDCNNYSGRRLLLSVSEREYVFSQDKTHLQRSQLRPGLLSKVLEAFMGEPDDSPYRFWLASCAESFLRGSSLQEQVFAAQSGLLEYLKRDVVSDKLHCAGSLQTAFDLLGELCKGNPEVLHLLFGQIEEAGFKRLMRVAASNLVDSNVFLRSLILSVERIVASGDLMNRKSTSFPESFSKSYLTHSWWDSTPDELPRRDGHRSGDGNPHPTCATDTSAVGQPYTKEGDCDRQSDWPSLPEHLCAATSEGNHEETLRLDDPARKSGWVFSLPVQFVSNNPSALRLSDTMVATNFCKRLVWFILANQTRLVRDLLDAVDLQNINHENICCLNTAVIVAVFAYRRQQLPTLIRELRRMNLEEMSLEREFVKRNIAEREFAQRAEEETYPGALDMSTMRTALRKVSEGQNTVLPRFQHIGLTCSDDTTELVSSPVLNTERLRERPDIMRNFRELLWFWSEYYMHRGRDRLSLEFSSQLRFQEWKNVVSLLAADDGSADSLVNSRLQLPRSPYRRPARIVDDSRSRGC